MYSPETSPSYLPKFMRGNEYDACPCKKVRFLALTTSAAFAGVAFYVNAVGHPARLELDNANALKQWKAMYARAAPMQVCCFDFGDGDKLEAEKLAVIKTDMIIYLLFSYYFLLLFSG